MGNIVQRTVRVGNSCAYGRLVADGEPSAQPRYRCKRYLTRPADPRIAIWIWSTRYLSSGARLGELPASKSVISISSATKTNQGDAWVRVACARSRSA